MEKLLTPEEVCGMLRIKKQRLYEWVHYNRIPYIKAGRFLRFSKEQIEEWLRENTYGIIHVDEQQD
jgi:excisionase family DNA binding protein